MNDYQLFLRIRKIRQRFFTPAVGTAVAVVVVVVIAEFFFVVATWRGERELCYGSVGLEFWSPVFFLFHRDPPWINWAECPIPSSNQSKLTS